MSSSDSTGPIHLTDLQREALPETRDDFVEQTQFERVNTAPAAGPSLDDAYEAGIAEGEQLGRAATLKEMQPVIARFEELIKALSHVRERRLEETERELTDLGVEIARRVLHGELQTGNDAVVRLARACIQEAKEEGTLTLRANPNDVELLRTHLPELELDMTDQQLRVEPDPRVPAGGVILETARACYDGRPHRVLEGLRQRIGSEVSG
jgi:flagellar biosynthesis/type III secretory pathway protein FliH